MNGKQNGEQSVVLSEDVVAKIVSIAAMDVYGVCGLVPAPDVKLMLKSGDARSVRVKSVDDALIVDLYIKLKMGVKITSVCENVQQSVKNSIQNMTNSVVSQVNVFVADIDFDENEAS